MPAVFQKLGDFASRFRSPNGDKARSSNRAERQRPAQRFGSKSPIGTHLDSLERLNQMFDPEKAAENDALVGDKALEAGNQSSFEFRVVNAFQKEVDEQRRLVDQNIRDKDAELKQNLPPEVTLEGDRILAKVETEQNNLLSDWETRLTDAKREVNRSKVELDTFRFNNRPVYARPARHPRFIVAAISMGAIVCLELLLNYNFLLTAGANTPAEIFSLVVMTALINLSLSAFGIGLLGLRNLGHVRSSQKAKGVLAILLFSCAVLLLHFLLAHYRLAIDGVLADPAAMEPTIRAKKISQIFVTMWSTITTRPAAFLGDLHSIIVFFMGLIFAGVAAVEGYFLIRDPYPGYQSKDETYQGASETFSMLMKEFENEVQKPTNDAAAQISEHLRQGERRLNSMKMHLDDAVSFTRGYEEEVSQLEYAMWQIIDAYRARYQLLSKNRPQQWQEDMPHLNRDVHFELDDVSRIEEQATIRFNVQRNQAAQLQAQLTKNLTALLGGLKDWLDKIDQDALHLEQMARNNVMGVRRPPPPSAASGF